MRTVLARRTAALCLAVVAAAGLVGGCTKDAGKHPAAPSPSAPAMSAAPGPGRVTATPAGDASAGSREGRVDYTDPESVAAAYVQAYVRHGWRDPAPRAYLDRIKPYATAAYVKKLRDSSSDRCDVSCEAAKKSRVEVSADNLHTVIPDEAPRSGTEVWVQVSYAERTSWSNGGESTQTGMILKLTRSGGKWLVDGRQGT
ncbi:hypothetical protein [Streptomyces sp. TP-A0356]|uniref:hypothetical protein n=1 Tax=Streptomyces sp. TP-A0356 TaxID=1359208 RepID=UPI0006E3F239|nr:hypothetical protein [Streptomyces sp. TP-A0356]